MLTMSSNQSLEGTQMLWDYLHKTYKQNTVAPAYQLFHKIHNTHLSNNGTITEYLEKITRQAFELDQLRWKIPDSIIASYMLLGLSDRYDSLISEIQNTPLGRNGSRTVSSPTKLTLLPISSARPSKNMETPKIPLPGLKPQKRSKWLKLL